MQKCRRCSAELDDLPATKVPGMKTLCLGCRDKYKSEQVENKKRYYREVIIDRRNAKRPPIIKDKAQKKEEKRLRRKIKRQNNIEKTRAYHREWRIRNKEKHSEYQKKYIASNDNRRFAARLRTLVYVSLKNQSIAKDINTTDLIGCSIDNLQAHLESLFQHGMSWTNHGRKGWHIDHIIPCSRFDLSDIIQQRECFHYTNLQPLWAVDNIRKSNKLIAA